MDGVYYGRTLALLQCLGHVPYQQEMTREREREEVSGVTEHCLHYRKHVSVDSAGVGQELVEE